MTDTPLIWTIHGNLPISELRYEHAWEDTDTYIKFMEAYYLGDELVKNNVHVYAKQPFPAMGAEQNPLI